MRLAVGAERAPGFDADIGKRSVLVVAIECGRRRIVGDVDVRPTVVVEVGYQHAEPISSIGLPDARFLRNVGERPVAVVVIERIYAARQPGRSTGDGQAFV